MWHKAKLLVNPLKRFVHNPNLQVCSFHPQFAQETLNLLVDVFLKHEPISNAVLTAHDFYNVAEW